MKLNRYAAPSFIAALALTIAVACSEMPTAPPPVDEIVGGTMFQAMYIADGSSLKFAGTATGPARLAAASRSPEEVAASLTLGQDSVRAAALSRRFTEASRTRALLSLEGNAHRRIKGRAFTQVVDGKRVDLIVMIDPDREAKRPSPGFVMRVNGKVASIVEWQYGKAANGKWRRTATRITTIDSAGRRLGVAEADETGAIYANATLRGAGQVLGAVGRLFAPDVLHAEDFTEYQAAYAGCSKEYWAMAGATAARNAHGLLSQSARALTAAAILSFTAAVAAAIDNPLLASAAEAAYATMIARELAEDAAFVAFAAATANLGAAGKALADCMTRKGGGGSGGEMGCSSNEEPVCDWSLYWDGSDSIHFEKSNCACEAIWAT